MPRWFLNSFASHRGKIYKMGGGCTCWLTGRASKFLYTLRFEERLRLTEIVAAISLLDTVILLRLNGYSFFGWMVLKSHFSVKIFVCFAAGETRRQSIFFIQPLQLPSNWSDSLSLCCHWHCKKSSSPCLECSHTHSGVRMFSNA